MDSISSKTASTYMINKNYRPLRNTAQAENTAAKPETITLQQKNDPASLAAISLGAIQSPNRNTLSGANVPTTMFALGVEQESAGRLTPEIAPLTNSYTPIEKMTNDRYLSFDYLEVVNNPHESLAEYKASYDEFLAEARDVVDQLKAMDDTGLLSFRFGITGPTVEIKNVDPKMLNAVNRSVSKIDKWISENASALKAIAEKGAAYAYASAEIDYQEKYGVSRDDAVHSGLNEIQKHALIIQSYASCHYGVNPFTEAESTERFGESGEFTYAPWTQEYSKFNAIA